MMINSQGETFLAELMQGSSKSGSFKIIMNIFAKSMQAVAKVVPQIIMSRWHSNE
jgi:hypothetical protein